MARYRLSSEIAEGIAPLSKLSSADVRVLAQEIDAKLKVKLAIEDEVADLIRRSSLWENLPEEDRLKLAGSITGLHLLRLSTTKSIIEVVSDIVGSFRDKNLGEEELDTLRENLTVILGIKVLQASVKAWTLIDDHHTIYLTSRIITDIRPVFDDDLEHPLMASLLTHNIKLTVRTEGRQKAVYVVADNADLKELRDNIDRALAKGSSLKTMILDNPDHWFGAPLGEDSEND